MSISSFHPQKEKDSRRVQGNSIMQDKIREQTKDREDTK